MPEVTTATVAENSAERRGSKEELARAIAPRDRIKDGLIVLFSTVLGALLDQAHPLHPELSAPSGRDDYGSASQTEFAITRRRALRRAHRLLKKVTGTHRWVLTGQGRRPLAFPCPDAADNPIARLRDRPHITGVNHPRATTLVFAAILVSTGFSQSQPSAPSAKSAKKAADPLQPMIARLELESYKATIKGLTKFGDRRQGTDRNRAALDWIEAQLKSYGYTNTARLKYEYAPTDPRRASGPRGATGDAQGGGRLRGLRARAGVNTDPLKQPDEKLRTLNSQPSDVGPRENVYCTKIGTTHPEEMYIVGAHMDGIGWGEAANDNGSGTAIVMELARIFMSPDVKTERSIRFALWNNEETGLNGAYAYVAQRAALQGREEPAGSGQYPEPRWLGMIQHDMMLFDHGAPRADGTVSKEQRPEADVNIEFQSLARFADAAQKLAWLFHAANEAYATDYPAAVGPHMTNTDSTPFMDLVPAISLRENERGREIGAGWDPHWHQPTDVYATFSDQDFRLGLNAAQTTLGAIARLCGATLTK